MNTTDSVIAVFSDHQAAEKAIKSVTDAGFPMKNLSVVGKGYHTEEKVLGFYNAGDRIKLWGSRGGFWGGFWGLFLGGAVLTIPIVGHVIVLGAIASTVVAAMEGAVVVGGLGGLAAALYGLGIPKDSVIEYETAIKADSFIILAHGSVEEVGRAKTILQGNNPSALNLHSTVKTAPVTPIHKETV